MGKTNKNCSIGDVVRVEFDDHSEGSQHIVFEVFGRVLDKSRRSFLIGSWLYSGSQEIDENSTVWTILRAGVRSIQILKPSDDTCQSKSNSAKSRRKPVNSASTAQEQAKAGFVDTTPPELPGSHE
jgi:hypothetical protein